MKCVARTILSWAALAVAVHMVSVPAMANDSPETLRAEPSSREETGSVDLAYPRVEGRETVGGAAKPMKHHPTAGADSRKVTEKCSWSAPGTQVCNNRSQNRVGNSEAKLVPVVSMQAVTPQGAPHGGVGIKADTPGTVHPATEGTLASTGFSANPVFATPAVRSAGAKDSGLTATNTAPASEPSTLAILLAGLGLALFMVIRRVG